MFERIEDGRRKNYTSYGKPHESTRGGYDEPTEVVKEYYHGEDGKVMNSNESKDFMKEHDIESRHHYEGSDIYNMASDFFNGLFGSK